MLHSEPAVGMGIWNQKAGRYTPKRIRGGGGGEKSVYGRTARKSTLSLIGGIHMWVGRRGARKLRRQLRR